MPIEVNEHSARRRACSRFSCRCRSAASLVAALLLVAAGAVAWAQPAAGGEELHLFEAVMCEQILAAAPRNATIIFSVGRGRAVCYTSFDEVPATTVIYHQWYHRDVPSAKIKLTLKSPRWSAYSSIRLQPVDVGPWRVEVTTADGKVLKVLRFSVTE